MSVGYESDSDAIPILIQHDIALFNLDSVIKIAVDGNYQIKHDNKDSIIIHVH